MLVEVITFAGCPHAADALVLARRLAAQVQGGIEVRLVEITERDVLEQRFLGSPTVRIDGHDVEPGAGSRRDFAFSCRLYQTPSGARPLPPEEWLRAALATPANLAARRARAAPGISSTP